PFLTRSGTQYQYNAPLFDASDPEQRNNRQLTASLSYFLSDRRLGSHELKGGVENFTDTRVGANSQTSTGYLFTTNFKVEAGSTLVDAKRLVPRLGASYDPMGSGRVVLQGSYARYSGKYNDQQFSKNTLVGNSNRYGFAYSGPAGEGRDFAAGFDPANYAG